MSTPQTEMVMPNRYPIMDPTSVLESLSQANSLLSKISTHVTSDGKLPIEEQTRVELLDKISKRALDITELHNEITSQDKVFFDDIDKIRELMKEQTDDMRLYQSDDDLKSLFIDYSAIYTKISADFDMLHIALTEQFAEAIHHKTSDMESIERFPLKRSLSEVAKIYMANTSITDMPTFNMGAKAKAAYNKVKNSKKYQYYLAGAILGCGALALTIICPPAGAAVSVGMWATFVAGAADGVITIGMSARDITNSVDEDFLDLKTKAKLENLIQEQKSVANALRDTQEIKNEDSITKQHDEILKELHDKTGKTIDAISTDIKDTIASCDLNEEDRQKMLATINESEVLLDIEKEIERLNNDLIVLLNHEQDGAEKSKAKAPKDIAQQFATIIDKLKEANGKVDLLEIPVKQKLQIKSGINDNIEHTKVLHQGFKKYVNSDTEFKKIAKGTLLKKIATCKRSRLISGFAIALAVTSIALAIAFPPAGALAVIATATVFCAQLALGGTALGMSAYDAHKSCKELSEHRSNLAQIEREDYSNDTDLSERMVSIDDDLQSLSEYNKNLAETGNSGDLLIPAPTCTVAHESHAVCHKKKFKTKLSSSAPSTPSATTRNHRGSTRNGT
ncbi:MAG: hypothetical protein HOI53_04410 [Francisellaceae bacterium]|nr:hypothetical protein [Francisellaceae bacterium]MBT6207246.1 hypothetical protein [Francisellaceae bacterium]